MDMPHCDYPFICGWALGCLHLVAAVDAAAVNMDVHLSFQDPAFNSFVYVPRSGITGSYSNSTFAGKRELPYRFP